MKNPAPFTYNMQLAMPDPITDCRLFDFKYTDQPEPAPINNEFLFAIDL